METIRPFSSRPHLCTVIDFENAKAARSVGLPTQPHAFQVPGFSIGDLVVCADGAQGRIREFKAHMAVVALAGSRCGINRAAALSSLRKLETE
ncbi:MAG TPA: hypothetical protein VEC60_15715 [Reyranella sp.]|nr:hypothetical protein [Reyranella sp.]